MIDVTLIEADGTRHSLRATADETLMEAARSGAVPGIDADCGGACACATCHVIVDAKWFAKVGEPSSVEADMLDMAPDRRETSRLSCQIKLSADLDGLVAHIPESQF